MPCNGHVKIGYAFGENIAAIVDKAQSIVRGRRVYMDEACGQVLGSLSPAETGSLSSFFRLYSLLERDAKHSDDTFQGDQDRLMKLFYLAEEVEDFIAAVKNLRQLITDSVSHNKRATRELLVSFDALEVSAVRYSDFWVRRRPELRDLAGVLQAQLDGIPNPFSRIEETLRGNIGLDEVGYILADNKYPNCSGRRWGGKTWMVGWGSPPEAATLENVLQIVSDEAAHWVLLDPFAADQRRQLTENLRKRSSSTGESEERLRDGVDGACMVLMEGFGHLFIGFDWTKEPPETLPEPRRMGEEGTLYSMSHRFTRWFHRHWGAFLAQPDTTAKDWAWICVQDNLPFFLDVAAEYMKRGTIY